MMMMLWVPLIAVVLGGWLSVSVPAMPDALLRYAMLCSAILCYDMLCYTLLCYTLLYSILPYAVLCCR